MKKVCLLCLSMCFLLSCNAYFVPDRKHQGVAWGGGAFASLDHQEFDLGFMRLEGKYNTYERGMTFQFPAIGIYGGSDHTSIGLLLGFTLYYRNREEPVYYNNKQVDY